MALPGNGLLVVSGEAALLVTALRRSTRWGSHSFPTEEYDVLMRMFTDLQTLLTAVDDLRLLGPTTFLAPFLELVRSKETTGPVTSLALSAINKFLAYGLIEPTHPSVPAAVEDIADAVTHARFVGTDPASDGVVLLKMLQVLRTLMLSPEGAMLTDESVCEIMLSCFRIAFESRLNELLRRNAEHCLRDMTQLVMMRLPQFSVEGEGVADAADSVGLSLRRKERTGKRGRVGSTARGQGSKTTDSGIALATQSSVATSKETQEKTDEAATESASETVNEISEAEITIELPAENRSPTKKHTRHSSMDLTSSENSSIAQILEKCVTHDNFDSDTDKNDENVEKTKDVQEDNDNSNQTKEDEQTSEIEETENVKEEQVKINSESKDVEEVVEQREDNAEIADDYVNPRGVRFTQQEDVANLHPYGLTCVRELLRFLISLCNPLDQQNTPAMVHLGLSLVGTALEVGADHLSKYPSLLVLVKDPLCRNLLSLLGSDRISIFALDLQVSFLLFESMRHHLKLQMESYFKKLIEIISADVTKAAYEMKEITHLALESLAQMFRIPGLCAELYLNYDCDIYCTNLFEDLTKLLSKHAVSSTAYNTHSLSLDALMTIIDAIESTCNQNKMAAVQIAKSDEASEEVNDVYGRGGHVSLELGGMDDASVVSDHVTHDISQYLTEVRIGRHVTTSEVPAVGDIDDIKRRKRWIAKGTELFNQKPEKGVEYLQQQGVLADPLDPTQVAMFLRENPALDKKMIGEYICKRSKCGDDGSPSVLAAFADSFDYTGLRIDKALRLYLETFRLPGEAPLIFLVMEHFAERWHLCNGSPFANTDAAFRLAYAVIMLNMDQHNHNAKKLNIPMLAADFVRNLRGCNGAGDFPQPMLEEVFNAIKSEEIVMPAEHTGILKENYLWKVLLRRGVQSRYLAAAPGALDDRLFDIVWGPTLTALSSAFERSPAPTPEDMEAANPRECAALRALAGLEQCAGIVASRRAQPRQTEEPTLDTLVLSMCKFTGLLSVPENASYISIGVALGQSTKGQLALRRTCTVIARHADYVRDAWKHLLEILRTLYIGRLLPKALVEAEDFLSDSGKVSLIREPSGQRSADSGLISSIYSYITLGENVSFRTPTASEKVYMDVALDCVAKCNLQGMLLADCKFLQLESLQELVKHLISAGAVPDAEYLQLNPQLEDLVVFYLELLTKITVQNRDRSLHIWPAVSAHVREVLEWGAALESSSYVTSRALTALLKAAVRLMRGEECASAVLASLAAVQSLHYPIFYKQAERISCGLYELVKTSAQNVHSAEDWGLLLSLLAAAGAGAGSWSDNDAFSTPSTGYCSASSRSEGSEDESGCAGTAGAVTAVSSDSELSTSPNAHGWIMVQSETRDAPAWQLEEVRLRPHRPAALARCTEALALVIRDVAHVTPYNFPACVRTVRLLVQASIDGGKKATSKAADRDRRGRHNRRARRHTDTSDEDDSKVDLYHTVSIQLLDLMHTLHSRTAQIFRWWREAAAEAGRESGDEEHDLWEVAWLPLLQGIAKLCTDSRKQVANSAVAYLQRALLCAGARAGCGAGWERCFHCVLFPLLESAASPARAHQAVCKVFLHHLSALSSRPTFPALWLRVVAVQRALVESAGSSVDDPLREAAVESLKNMILVMDSVKIFSGADGYNDLWALTWEHIGQFLPNLKIELFPHLAHETLPASVPAPLPTVAPPPSAAPPPAVAPPSAAAPPPAAIRNPLYMSPPSSSVLLQPLSQMVSTPIGIAVPAHTHQTIQPGFPILYPNRQPEASQLASINILEPSRPTSFTLVSHDNPDCKKYPELPKHVENSTFEAIVPNNNIPELVNISKANVSSNISELPNISSPIPINNVIDLQNISRPYIPELGNSSKPNLSATNITEFKHTPLTNIQAPQSNSRTITSVHNNPEYQTAPNIFATNIQELQNMVRSNYSESNLGEDPKVRNLNPNVNTAINLDIDSTEHTELYAEYLTNPYNEAKEVSPKELTLYNPASVEQKNDNLQKNKLKSQSVDCSPMHKQAQFSSTDNLQRESSGMFNFSSYFGVGSSDIPPGSEILFGDAEIPSPEG